MWRGHDADHSPSSSVEVKNEWSFTSPPPLRLHGVNIGNISWTKHTYIGYTHIRIQCMYTYIHTYIHTYLHTYIHTYIHTHTHIHIHLRTRAPLDSWHTIFVIKPSPELKRWRRQSSLTTERIVAFCSVVSMQLYLPYVCQLVVMKSSKNWE